MTPRTLASIHATLAAATLAAATFRQSAETHRARGDADLAADMDARAEETDATVRAILAALAR